MRRFVVLPFAALYAVSSMAAADPGFAAAEQRLADLDWLVARFEEKYAYRDKRNLDWKNISRAYRDDATQANDKAAWVAVLEHVVAELYDHHASLGTNTSKSPQLVPSGTDIWAEVIAGSPAIVQVRPGSVAFKAGLRGGMVVRTIAEEPVAAAISRWRPRTLLKADAEADSFALRVSLAGNHVDRRRFVACAAGDRCKPFDLDPVTEHDAGERVTWRMVDGELGLVRIENSLGDTGTIADFDRALEKLKGAKGFILDLRNTPSGGNTGTAEPILGRFISKRQGYQRVFEPGPRRTFESDSWTKDVAPRGATVDRPLVVLVDHWTGSMGEGMAIGLHAMKRAKIVGTKMAGLLGGTGSFELPNTRVSVRFPIERLYHLDGTPRELFEPGTLVDAASGGDDPILAAGLEELRKELTARSP